MMRQQPIILNKKMLTSKPSECAALYLAGSITSAVFKNYRTKHY